MKSSVFAAVPCTSGSAERMANKTAEITAQNCFMKRDAKKKSAQADAAENNSPIK